MAIDCCAFASQFTLEEFSMVSPSLLMLKNACRGAWLNKHIHGNKNLLSVLMSNSKRYSSYSETMLKAQAHHFTPTAVPPKMDDITSLCKLLQESTNLAVLTGAGISTESGIPDYRSPNGAYSKGFKPITHQEFLRSERNRTRYWARSYVGWNRFASAQPGPTHKAIAELEIRGYVSNIITQNVDRLHHLAGSNPLELHGTTHEVICIECSDLTSRQDFQDRMKAINPEWAEAMANLENGKEIESIGMHQRPDGDVEIDESFWEGRFKVPNCQQCKGILKPNVVLFGDNLPKPRAKAAESMIDTSDGLLVVGSSLMVLSAFRLAMKARERDTPLAIINIGPTRADELASLKIESRSGEILSKVLQFLAK